MSRSLVSIIIPCFNSAQFLDECLNSVYNQTYKNWEAVIVNDGSTDNINQVIKPWLIKDKRFKYFSKPNEGLSKTRIYGIEKSFGDYILPLDSDDYIKDTYIEKACDILNKKKEIEIVYSEVKFFGAKNTIFKLEPFSFKYLLKKNCITATSFFRRESYNEVGGYCSELTSLEDWDLWISLLKNGGKVYKINEVLFYYRIHKSGSLSNNLFKDLDKYKEYHNIIFKRHYNAFLEHVGNPILIKRELDRLKEKQNLPLRKKIINQLKNIYSRIIK